MNDGFVFLFIFMLSNVSITLLFRWKIVCRRIMIWCVGKQYSLYCLIVLSIKAILLYLLDLRTKVWNFRSRIVSLCYKARIDLKALVHHVNLIWSNLFESSLACCWIAGFTFTIWSERFFAFYGRIDLIEKQWHLARETHLSTISM